MDGEDERGDSGLVKLPPAHVLEKMFEAQLRQVELQHEELALRKEELELQKQNSKQGFDYSNRVLDANIDDLKTVRANESVDGVRRAVVVLLFLVLVFGFLFFAMWINKEAVIFQVLEKVAYIVGGGGAVVIYNNVRKKKDDVGIEEEDSE